MIRYVDKKNHFVELFNPETGFYVRSGVIDENGNDTGVDPFMRSMPGLIDVGIMQTCVCSHRCNVDCYQKAIDRRGPNMSVEDFELILKQCEGKTFQLALGGAGDVDTHENFEAILKLCRQYGIVPNFTTSGILMNKKKAQICKEYCGAVAVSEHHADYTDKALNLLLDAGVKTNIHYVLSKKSIGDAIQKLRTNSFKAGINAVIFLLYKPIGLGKSENVLSAEDPKVAEFFEIIDQGQFHHKIGFDSCSCSGIVNFTSKIDLDSIDYCESSRYSAYIDANLNMMPCSFANQDSSWFVSLRDHTIQEAWESEVFERFRYSLKNSCSGCDKRLLCGGGCPIVNEITLCNKSERNFVTF